MKASRWATDTQNQPARASAQNVRDGTVAPRQHAVDQQQTQPTPHAAVPTASTSAVLPPTAAPSTSTPPSHTSTADNGHYETGFAQTRAPGDLFDDDFTPLAQPGELVPDPDVEHTPDDDPRPYVIADQSPEITPSLQALQRELRQAQAAVQAAGRRSLGASAAASAGGNGVPMDAPRGPRAGRGRGARRGVGAAGARGGRAAEGGSAVGGAVALAKADVPAAEGDVKSEEVAEKDGKENGKDGQGAKPERKEGAVRGDRSGTGGVKKAKLTEEELAQKLEAMKLKNASLMEKFEREQADISSFEAREAVAAQRRREERLNRQQMMGERERNRQRKLQALGGREWDMEKKEEDFAGPDRRGGPRRGMYGGVGAVGSRITAPDGPEAAREERGFNGGGGRGGFGGSGSGRGRGRGRGHARESNGADRTYGNQHHQVEKKQEQKAPTAADFPDLPPSTAPKMDGKAPMKIELPIKKPGREKNALAALASPGERKSWAEQVEDGLKEG